MRELTIKKLLMTLERVSQTAEPPRRERRQTVPGKEPPGMLKLIKRFSRMVRYKINIQIPVTFLYSNLN